MRRLLILGLAWLVFCGVASAASNSNGPGGAGGTGSESTCNTSGQISGGAYDPKCSVFGALGVGAIGYDGAVPALTATGTGVTATSPTYTTNLANELLLTFFGLYSGSVPSTPGGQTARVTLTSVGVAAYEQSAATTGSYGGVALTQSSAGWQAFTVPIFATSGHSVSFNAASAVAASSTTNIRPSVPAGTVSGNTMFAVILAIANVTVTAPANNSWVQIAHATAGGSSGQTFIFERVAGGSEPGTYTWTCSNTCFGGGAIVSYANVGGIDDALTSASASFSSALVGDLACVAGASCGTGVPTGGAISGTKLIFGGMNNGTSALSGAEYRYATNDTAAIQAAYTTVCTTGGTLQIPPGNYGLNASIACPSNLSSTFYSVSTVGSGATFGNFHFAGSLNPAGNTTGLWWETQAIASNSCAWFGQGYPGLIAGITFYAGAGLNGNFGGGNGLCPSGYTTVMDDSVSNFSQSDIYYGTNSGANGLGVISNTQTQWAGQDGLRIDSTVMQNLAVRDNSEFQNNYGCGINITQWGSTAGNILIENSIIQGNELGAFSNSGELCASQNMDGEVALHSDWVDSTYPNNHSVINSGDLAFFAGTVFDQVFSVAQLSNIPPFTYAHSGTQLPNCSARFEHTAGTVCVTDAANYTVGSTYTPSAGAGSDLEAVECNGTNWIQTGTSKGCN